MQWCCSIGILTLLHRLVWPIYMIGLTSSPRLSSKLGICQFWVSTYAPLFLGKACVPWNISQSPKLHWNNKKHLLQSCLAFKSDIVYRSSHLILLNILTSILLHVEPSLSTYYLGCEFMKYQLKIILTLVSYCGCIKWPNCYKFNQSPQYLDWMMARLLLNPFDLFSTSLPICLGLCKCPTTRFLTTNLGLKKLWNLNSRSSSPTGQISVNGI